MFHKLAQNDNLIMVLVCFVYLFNSCCFNVYPIKLLLKSMERCTLLFKSKMDVVQLSDSEEVQDVECLEIKTTSHKGEKVRSYTAKFKIEAVAFAEQHSISASAKKFKVDRRTVREWKSKKEEIALLVKRGSTDRKRLDGGGRKQLSVCLEKKILEWISDRRCKRLRIS